MGVSHQISHAARCCYSNWVSLPARSACPQSLLIAYVDEKGQTGREKFFFPSFPARAPRSPHAMKSTRAASPSKGLGRKQLVD